MSDLLHDPAIHRQLVEAVRTRCPEDWKASRRHRLARMRTHGGWLAAPLMFVWPLILGLVLGAPFFWVGEHGLKSHEAAGLAALHLLCASLVVGRTIINAHALHLSPLISMPVSLAQLHLHLLRHQRRHARRTIGYGLLSFVTAFYTVIVGMLESVDWPTALWRVPAAAFLAVGPALALDGLLDLLLKIAVHLPRLIRRCLALVPVALFGIFFWEFIYALERSPSPGIVGDLLSVLPQARLCEWVRGGDCPWQVVLLCLGCAVISGWRLHENLRDSKPELNEDHMHDTSERTAESLLAQVLKVRRMKQAWPHHSSHREWNNDDEIEDADQDEEDEDVSAELTPDEDKAWLFGHESAPREHNTPVTPEFRAVMVAEVQRLLDAPPRDCLQQKMLSLGRPQTPGRREICQNATLLGVVPLALVELQKFMPETWNFWLQFAPSIAAVLISLKCLQWLTFKNQLSVGFLIPRFWPKIPLDGSLWLTQFGILERHWLRWRSQFAVLSLVTFALTCGVISLLKMTFGWQTGLVQIHMLHKGLLSLPSMTLLLLVLAWGARCFEWIAFVNSVASAIKWRGIWCLWLPLHLIIHLLSIVAMAMTLIHGIAMLAVDWDPKVGVPVEVLTLGVVGPPLLVTAVLQWFGHWLAAKSLRTGDGSVK